MATAPNPKAPAAEPATKPEKQVVFWGSSLKDLRDFPPDPRQDCGYQLNKVQHGEQPDNFKPVPTVGKGVEEIRVHDEDGWFRVLYTARFEDAVHVLHAFQKKTNQTSQADIEIGQKRYKLLMDSLKQQKGQKQ